MWVQSCSVVKFIGLQDIDKTDPESQYIDELDLIYETFKPQLKMVKI